MEEAARKQKESLEASKEKKASMQHNRRVITTTTSSNIETASHGEYVETEDGVSGIVIDNDYIIRKVYETDQTRKSLMNIIDESVSLISDVNFKENDYGADAPEGYNPGVEYILNNPYEPKVQDMKKIKDGFKTLAFGLPNHGLVEAGSEEAKNVAEALELVRSGKVILPTPEEYEQQKKELAEKKRKEKERLLNQGKEQQPHMTDNNQQIKQPVTETTLERFSSEYEMDDSLYKNSKIKEGVEELLNLLNNLEQTGRPVEVVHQNQPVDNTVNPNTFSPENSGQNVNTIAPAQEVMEPEKVPTTPPITPEPTKPVAPLNIAEMMDNQQVNQVPQQQVTPQQEPGSNIVEINVPAGEASTLMQNLPLETYDKVVTANTIQVNAVEVKDVPVATRSITSMEDYKKLASRRKHRASAEITERVLVNSGFIVTLKPATSLEMATIFKSPVSSDIDWEKEYRFCYEHTIGTSLGKMSYNEYVNKVHPSDIESVLYGIYQISEQEERNISINCSEGQGCGNQYEYKALIKDLPNLDRVPEKTSIRIKEIIDAKGDLERTKKLNENSPVSIVKYVTLGDRCIAIRSTTGPMMISRIDIIDELAEQYGAMVAMMLMYIENVKVTIQERPDVAPTTFLIEEDINVLCEEILQFTDEELTIVKEIIKNEIAEGEFTTISYSIKGPIVCPNCGHTETEIPCNVSDLVFQKAQSVLG